MVRPITIAKLQPFVVVVGPTASGKSNLAMRLCRAFGGELVSCDSVQIYRHLDIGSAKPTLEDQRQVPHHLIDVADVGDDYDAGRYAKDARCTIAEIQARGRLAIVAGGTGLYLRSLLGERFHEDLPRNDQLRRRLAGKTGDWLYRILKRLDPQRASQLHPNDRVRIERAVELRLLLGHPVADLPPAEPGLRQSVYLIYINPDPDHLRIKIKHRAKQMIAAGLVNEVERLQAAGVGGHEKPMQSIGYLQATEYLAGRLSKSALVDAVAVATSQYAKRQRTWFKKLNADLEIADPAQAWDKVERGVRTFLRVSATGAKAADRFS